MLPCREGGIDARHGAPSFRLSRPLASVRRCCVCGASVQLFPTPLTALRAGRDVPHDSFATLVEV